MPRFLPIAACATLLLSTACVEPIESSTGVSLAGGYEATIVAVEGEETMQFTGQLPTLHQSMRVRISRGDKTGQEVLADSFTQTSRPEAVRLKPGDQVVVRPAPNAGATGGDRWSVADVVRLPPLYLLAGLFALSILAVGRWRGLSSLAGLIMTFVVLVKVIMPLLLTGANPVLVSVAGSCMLLVLTQYLAHGFNRKTTVAIAGTAASLALSGTLGAFFLDAAHLSGLSLELLQVQSLSPGANLDFRALLLGGMIVGVVGLLADVTIGQSSVVFALRDANRDIGWRELYNRAMVVGQDHIASLVYTLLLVYAGASLPLFLVFSSYDIAFGTALNQEDIATEAFRTLVGSLGLVAAVPITTAIAARVALAAPPGASGADPHAGHGH